MNNSQYIHKGESERQQLAIKPNHYYGVPSTVECRESDVSNRS